MAESPLSRHQELTPSALRSGDPERIKALYKLLGEDMWEAGSFDLAAVPVLSAPETLPAVCRLLDTTTGLFLDAGCGPNPAVSIALARMPFRRIVAMDIGVGTVRTARAVAARQGVSLLGVAGDLERMPFRDEAFAAAVCDDTIEHLPDDRAGIAELARVVGKGLPVVLATPNRHSAVVLRYRLKDLLAGRRRSRRDYFVSTSHLREYTWAELGRLVGPYLQVVTRVPVGWSGSRKRLLASYLLSLPGLYRFSQMIVVLARRR